MNKKPSYIVFDYDGTLVDAFEALVNVINAFLKIMGKDKVVKGEDLKPAAPYKNLDFFSYFYEEGVTPKLYNDIILPLRMKEEKEKAIIYDGVVETLESLKKKGIRLFVLTNRDQKMAKIATEMMFGDSVFEGVIGMNDDGIGKPSKEFTFRLLDKYELDPSNGLYVGDTLTDKLAAENVNMPYVMVDYQNKYQSLKDCPVINNFKELLKLF